MIKCKRKACLKLVESNDLCHEHYHEKYRKQNRVRINDARKEYRRKYPEKVASCQRARKYQLLYNISIEDYDRMVAYQKVHPVYRLVLGKATQTKRDSVEHRHSDGLIRGAMASMLNRAYGLIERLYPNNTAEVLRALAEFHENPPAVAALGEEVYGLIGRAARKRRMVYGPDGRTSPRPRKV